MTTETANFTVYAQGICMASVCSSLPAEDIAWRMNDEEPTGIASRWVLSKEPTFSTGEPNPTPCNCNPETHMHYLLEC